jgi:hypothetical protein
MFPKNNNSSWNTEICFIIRTHHLKDVTVISKNEIFNFHYYYFAEHEEFYFD